VGFVFVLAVGIVGDGPGDEEVGNVGVSGDGEVGSSGISWAMPIREVALGNVYTSYATGLEADGLRIVWRVGLMRRVRRRGDGPEGGRIAMFSIQVGLGYW
jgi:hypothetical protein